MNCGSWNAGELRQLANRRERLLLEGIENSVTDNGARKFFGAVAGNRGDYQWHSCLVTVEYAIASEPSAVTNLLSMADMGFEPMNGVTAGHQGRVEALPEK
jgi:hypothetical protein